MKSLSTALFVIMGLLPVLHASPKLVVAPEIYDFGEAPSGESVQATFTLRNEGDAPLHVADVRTSCGCTTTVLEKRDLAPGEEMPLAATLSLKNRHGPQSKRVTIGSNDPDQPNVLAIIQGTAIRHLTITPSIIYLFSATQGQPITRTVEILSDHNAPFQNSHHRSQPSRSGHRGGTPLHQRLSPLPHPAPHLARRAHQRITAHPHRSPPRPASHLRNRWNHANSRGKPCDNPKISAGYICSPCSV